MDYHKYIIRYKNGTERCIVANDIALDMRTFEAKIRLGYSYSVKHYERMEYHSYVDVTNIPLCEVDFIAELRCHYNGMFDELDYIYRQGKKGGVQHD